jgi:hypothetical protein
MAETGRSGALPRGYPAGSADFPLRDANRIPGARGLSPEAAGHVYLIGKFSTGEW